MGVET